MNKLWMSASLLLVTAALTAQKADSVAQAQRQQEYLANYKRALLYDDMPSAAYALTGYLQNGGQDSYKDSLAIIYYRSGNLNGSYRLANESYTADNKNVTALTLLADITGRAGDNKASLDWYEKLSALAPSPYNYYQLATRQFILERVGECRQTLQKVVADSVKAKEEQVTLEIGQGQGENVP
ncbi:MAG TPA: hypothetical protein PKD90_12810, partial [Phnomibacter sp.]|nr:hypothetical protein [Phnomibacter sp.]